MDPHGSASTSQIDLVDLMVECENLVEFYGKEFLAFEKRDSGFIEGVFIGRPSIASQALVLAPKTVACSQNLLLSPLPKICQSDASLLTYIVKYLPPIFVQFSQIRSTCAPYLSFSLRCSWLNDNQLEIVKSQMQDICSENPCSPLGSCFVFVEHEMLQYMFPPLSVDHDCAISFTNVSPREDSIKLRSILEHNEYALREISPDSVYECDVCTGFGRGSDFLRFVNCGHLFCRKCIASAFTNQIENHFNGGNPSCLTCDKEVAQFEVS